MNNDKILNAKRNLSSSIINKMVNILLPFILRTIIIYILGDKFAGLNGLFTSLLNVLNLAELGFSSSITYSLYQPISQGDDDKICKILKYFKSIYRIIGVVILGIGLILTPFITFLINGDYPSNINIYVVFIMYLINTSLSYCLCGYKTALLDASQRIDLINKTNLLTHGIQYTLQIFALLLFENYYVYLIFLPLSTVFYNLVINYIFNKRFSKYKPKGKLDIEEKNKIKKQVAGLMVGKLSDTSRNSFDNIIISYFLGLSIVAIYGNYYYIYSAVYSIMLAITHSLQAIIGNDIASMSEEKNYKVLIKLTQIFQIIICMFSCFMFILYQPFMMIWVGNEYLMTTFNMMLFCLYFYVINMNNTKNLYFSGCGLWWKSKKIFLLEAISNLILNIILGYFFGVSGVLIASIVTILLFNFILRTNMLFKIYFKKNPISFYILHIKFVILTGILFLLIRLIERTLGENNILGIILNISIVLICTSILIYKFYVLNKEIIVKIRRK